jgi:hypothetical protein
VAILGTDLLDVRDVDASTVLLEGVAPLEHSFDDVATPVMEGDPCGCTEEGPE